MSGPAPLKVEALKVDECLKGGTGSHCYVGYDDVSAQYGWLQLRRGLAGPRASPTPGVVPVHRRRERPEGLRRSDGGMGTSSGFQPTLWNIPVWVCAKDGKNTFCSARDPGLDRDTGNPPPPGASAGCLLPVVAPSSGPCPAEGCWPGSVKSVASYPVIRFQGFYIENVWETGNDVNKGWGWRTSAGSTRRPRGMRSASS